MSFIFGIMAGVGLGSMLVGLEKDTPRVVALGGVMLGMGMYTPINTLFRLFA